MSISTRRRAYIWGLLEIQADFAKARDTVLYRVNGKGEFQASPYQVASAGHSVPKALSMVNRWLRGQNGGTPRH